mgnify:CR=1 FL=1
MCGGVCYEQNEKTRRPRPSAGVGGKPCTENGVIKTQVTGADVRRGIKGEEVCMLGQHSGVCIVLRCVWRQVVCTCCAYVCTC